MNTGMIRPHVNSLAMLFRLVDAAIIFGTLVFTAFFYSADFDLFLINSGLLGVLLFWAIAEFNNLYRSWRSIRFLEQASATATVWGVTAVIMLAVGYFIKGADIYPRSATLFWFALTMLLLLGWRYVYHQLLYILRSRDFNTRTAIIVAFNKSALNLANEFKWNPRHGIKFLGFYDDRSVARSDTNVDIRGDVADALEMTKSGKVDNVYIALPLHAEKRTQELLEMFADTTANVYLIPNFFVYNLLYSRWREVGDVLTLSIYDSPHISVSGWLKRIEDIVLSSLLILMLAIPMLIVAIIIKVTSRGPVIFSQFRYGLDGQKFRVYKFRSMTVAEDGPVVKQATQNDARITRIGRFIRRTSIDELPQLFNVLEGTMSLVGPRPHAVAHNEEYRKLIKRYMLRHKVKPGITGWAQIHGLRGETDTLDKMERRIEYDLDYIHKWSLWLDFKILFLTLYRTRQIATNAY